MKFKKVKSIRTFIGSKNFSLSKRFYSEIGFSELPTSKKMSFFHIQDFGFYLQDYFVEDWANNSMMFLEVEDIKTTYKDIKALNLPTKYEDVKLSEISNNDWGSEFFLHDPAGVLWHIGTFKN